MHAALYPSLFFTVVMLITTTYFLLGGLPLLVLKHDTPLDARFVRGFFNVYYKTAFVAALGAALSYGAWGRPVYALGAAGIALLVAWLRKRLIPAMDHLDGRIQAQDEQATRSFRQVHTMALMMNLLQLVVIVWATIRLSL